MPNSKPPGRKPPGRKPPFRKPGGRKPGGGGGPRGPKSASGASGWKPGGPKPGGRKPGARNPDGAKRAGSWKPGARKPGGKPPTWKPGGKPPTWKSPGRKHDSPPRAARPRRDAQDRRAEEAAPTFEEGRPRTRPLPREWDKDEPRRKRREPPPRDRSPRDESPRALSRSEKPERPREELPRVLIRRKPWLQMPPRRETPARGTPPLTAGLETSDIRRGVREAIADAHATGPDARRARTARAEEVGSDLLQRVAAPLFRTIASVLIAEGYRFTVSTPPGVVRLTSEASGDNYVELALNTKCDPPALLVRSARVRRDEGVIDERVVAEHPAIGALTDAHLFTAVLTGLRFIVDR